eukprot:11469368-Prorocentrum_lima.AAC.1
MAGLGDTLRDYATPVHPHAMDIAARVLWDMNLIWPITGQRNLAAWIERRCSLERSRPSRQEQWNLGITLWALELRWASLA